MSGETIKFTLKKRDPLIIKLSEYIEITKDNKKIRYVISMFTDMDNNTIEVLLTSLDPN